MSGKRKLAVPILLIAMTAMAILIVLLFSKVLLNDQASSTDRGIRLAEQYEQCQAYAAALQGGTESLATADTAADRLPAAAQLGQLAPLEEGCAEVLSRKAVNPENDEEAAKQSILADLEKIRAAAQQIGLHEGPATDEEQAALAKLRAGGEELAGILGQYTVPAEGDRYRQMAAGVDWTKPAADAALRIRELAESLPSKG
ncbi:hypothetical protein [Cohnella thailandensis]|uniref:Uncharacterized protein n=1 Tax=Cohnella thailandensis TaxID=557557 RepID=A0A841T2C6_9BACL|nr:hypothetical protein [Cohnella thailandensis]MBB6636220.1 hypothetical protein [Cohnella thailandensis]MBP1973811.1 hypothetical protein [Cohnella thailandensis]